MRLPNTLLASVMDATEISPLCALSLQDVLKSEH